MLSFAAKMIITTPIDIRCSVIEMIFMEADRLELMGDHQSALDHKSAAHEMLNQSYMDVCRQEIEKSHPADEIFEEEISIDVF